jgi:hypothetical protein
MLRKIAKSVEEKALQLWIEGHAYRSISDRLGISLGVVSRIVGDARKRALDLDELRKLNVMLKRGESSVHDATRGAKLLNRLNEYGIGLDKLDAYIELCEKISPERGVEAEKFVDAGVRLVGLEVKTGKNYEGVLKDFEERTKHVEGLDAKAKGIQGQIQGLMERKTQLESEIRDAEERFSSTRQELNKAVSTHERLKKIGLKKVSDLARFDENFELLGFDANMVKTLAEWRESLKEMGINPDALGRFVKEKGPLEAQTSKMRSELKDTERKIETIRNEHRRLFEETTTLQAKVLKLGKLGKVVKLGRVIIPCKVCGREGIFVKLHTASEYRGLMRSGVALQYKCLYCGQWSMYTPWDILTEVGLMAAPEQIKEAQTLAKD